MSADSITLTIFQELITHGYNEVCNRDALKMWGIPKLLYSTMAGDSEHTHQGQSVSATRAGTRTILCTSLASGSSTVPNTKYRRRINSRCQTPLWPSAASRDRCPTLLRSTQESLDTLLADTHGPLKAFPHLEAARMNNLIADTAFHEFLLKVLCLLVLIHLSTEGTCDRVRQSGL